MAEEEARGQLRRFEQKNGIRLDDEVRFIRTWIEKPLSIGAVTPSGKALARTMAGYVDPARPGPIVELGPGTGPVTEALRGAGVDPSRLVLVEFNPTFCRLLRERLSQATVVQGDAYSLKAASGLLQEPAAAVVSGLPLFTKPLQMRLRLLFEAFRSDVSRDRRSSSSPITRCRPFPRRSIGSPPKPPSGLAEHSSGSGVGVSQRLRGMTEGCAERCSRALLRPDQRSVARRFRMLAAPVHVPNRPASTRSL